MKIPKEAIVSNSDIIKNYKTQRDRVEMIGKLFIFKNNQPDAVLFSIDAYDKVADYLELLEIMNDEEREKLLDMILQHKRRINL